MIASANADTLHMIERGINIAGEPEELFVVPGMTHVHLYDHPNISLPKLVDFFTTHL